MHPARYLLLTTGLLLALPVSALHAEGGQQPSAAEAKLRESLRNTMLQLRTSENEKAVLQAAQAESDEKIKTLTAQAEALTKRINDDKVAAEKVKAELEAQLAERDQSISNVRHELATVTADDKKVSDLVKLEATQISKLQDQVNVLNRRVADQQSKNAAMFKIANEILQRYEKFGLGDALTAREPFTGLTRVKLQSLFEDYQDKLVDQRIKPEAPETKTPPSADKPGKQKPTAAKPADAKPKS